MANIHSTDDHLDTGVLGSKYLLHALTQNGQAELAYKVASQTTQPSWGWWIKQGANTLWETWTDEGSHNHIFMGDCVNWYVRTLVGINPDPAAPGFKHIIIKPQPLGDLTFAEARYESVPRPNFLSLGPQWRRVQVEAANPREHHGHGLPADDRRELNS